MAEFRLTQQAAAPSPAGPVLPLSQGSGSSQNDEPQFLAAGIRSQSGRELAQLSADDFFAEYKMGHELGTGGFSVVYSVTDEDGKRWALKRMSKQRIAATGGAGGSNAMRRLRDEIRALARLRHPAIVRLHDVFETRSDLCLLMERVDGGELFDRIVELGHFSEPNAAHVMRQLFGALFFVHGQGVIHRDIKPENILLVSRDSWDIKLSDFGLVKLCDDFGEEEARRLSQQEEPEDGLAGLMERLRADTICGSSQYIAPEVAFCRGGAQYGAPVDIWSSGVVLYILLCGHPPWESGKPPSPFESHENVVPFWPQTWGGVSEAARAFVLHLLTVDAAKRPTAEAALQHAWLEPTAAAEPEEPAAKRRLSIKYIDNMRQMQTAKRARARESARVSIRGRASSEEWGSMQSSCPDSVRSLNDSMCEEGPPSAPSSPEMSAPGGKRAR
jgi:serine/threonine protein kinase